MRIFTFLFMVFIFLPAHAESVNPKIVRSNSLEASLIVTDQGTQMYKEWEKDHMLFPVWHINKLERGIKNVLIVLVTDCTPDENGYCNLILSYKNFRPDGTLYGQYLNRSVKPYHGNQKTMPPYLAQSYMVLTIEPTDPEGEYSLQAYVTDQISKETVHLTESATVSEPMQPNKVINYAPSAPDAATQRRL